ncbi:MAG: hypothetical protein QF535_09350, partial [Anaerolineales bacterium]|nr:hypothetical protein [Anaerolineales bacterium]
MNTMKKLLSAIAIMGTLFAQEAEPVCSTCTEMVVSGEMSTDVMYGDTVSFTSHYTGLSLSGEGWQLSSQLTDGNMTVEEAYYTLDANFAALTIGKQRVPFGLANAWHRPSQNPFASEPSAQTYAEGIGVTVEMMGVGVEAHYGNEQAYSARLSYDVLGHSVGLSTNSDDGMLVDVSGACAGMVTSYLQYDLSDTTSGDFWYRAVIAPEFTKGISALVGYSSVGDET